MTQPMSMLTTSPPLRKMMCTGIGTRCANARLLSSETAQKSATCAAYGASGILRLRSAGSGNGRGRGRKGTRAGRRTRKRGRPAAATSANCARVMSEPACGCARVSCSSVSALLEGAVSLRKTRRKRRRRAHLQHPPKMSERVVAQSATRASVRPRRPWDAVREFMAVGWRDGRCGEDARWARTSERGRRNLVRDSGRLLGDSAWIWDEA